MHAQYKKIGLLDHMGLGNMGDAAICEAFVENIRIRNPRSMLTAFSLNPQDTKRRHGIETAYPIKWDFPARLGIATEDVTQSTLGGKQFTWKTGLKTLVKRLPSLYRFLTSARERTRRIGYPIYEIAHLVRSYRRIRSLDVLVLSGGGQLCELWRDLPYNVFKFCFLAKLACKPLFLVGIGAGPLDRPWNKLFGKWSVGLSDYTSFRDIESQSLVADLGSKAETHVCPDPAYSLDLSQYVKSSGLCRARPKVGINVMAFCDPRLWPRKDEGKYRSYLDKIHQFILWLLSENYAVEIFTSDLLIDRYAIEDLRMMLEPDQTGLHERLTIRPIVGLRELLEQMSEFDFVVTSKFHGVVFSHLLGKPVIGLSYHYKIDNLMRAVGHSEYCLDVESFDVDMLTQQFHSLVERAASLRKLFATAVASYRLRLNAEFDRLVIPTSNLLAETSDVAQQAVCQRAVPE